MAMMGVLGAAAFQQMSKLRFNVVITWPRKSWGFNLGDLTPKPTF